MKEFHVGDGWRYECWTCRHQVTLDAAIPQTCPGCGHAGWWGHLVTLPKVAADNKSPVKELWQQERDSVTGERRQNTGDLTAVGEPHRRGPKFHATPDDLIKELAGQGHGPRVITRELEERHKPVPLRTVCRRLAALRQQGSFL